MDLISSCKDKLAYFRIKELKDVLTQLGVPKQGRKQDLVDRILQLLLDDQVLKLQVWGKRNPFRNDEIAKIIDDTYRKMQVTGAMDLASKSSNVADLNQVKPKDEIDDYHLEMTIQCPCKNSLDSDSTIQCEEPQCQVWQHIGCVIIPERPLEGASPELPPHFYCELCRINKADPFWVTLGHPLLPAKLTSSVVSGDGTITVQNMERTFQLSRANKEMLQRSECDLQVWCLLLNDKVSFRMQWPQYAELQVNGVAVRVVTRAGSQLLGINGRDDGSLINTCSKEGINKISLSWRDTRVFCFGIRLARKRSVQQVLNLVPKEADGEHFEDALARVCRCIGGGAATENAADDDSDLEVVADSVTVNLRCPMSGSRMKIASRFKPCVHMGCFDLHSFVELNERSRKWQCPICLKNYSLENIIIDPYFNRITSLLQNCGEDVNEIDVKPDGSWRAKIENEYSNLSKWHRPDGTLCADTYTDVNTDSGKLKLVKQEGSSEGHTSLKLKRNREGVWEVSKPENMCRPSSHSHVLTKHEDHCQLLPMNSSTNGNYRDVEDQSVNGEAPEQYFDLSLSNGHDLDSLAINFDPTYCVEDRAPSSNNPDVIVLSDSDDEDNPTPISPETVYDPHPAPGGEIAFSVNPGVSDRFTEDAGLGTSGASGLGLFENHSDDFEMSVWPMQTCPQSSPGFQLFGANTEVQVPLVDTHNSFGSTLDGYGLASNGGLRDGSQIHEFSACNSSSEIHGSLVDNPLAFQSDDPSLQIFLPSQPAGIPLQSNLSDRPEVPNGVSSDDWISLTLAAGGDNSESGPVNRPRSRQQFQPKETRVEPPDETASLVLSMNDKRVNKANTKNQRFDDPLSQHPRQPRSVRPRFHLFIDCDSD
ncbi:E3 SUMO-protein ligase [Canna indica]|uniref:E3 SUMO-protein ligase SIZ1 n=1 Tax=Canna indica TaxID=4628 RepID=A0AAQ3KWC3_9LILI|nr:E3 SUMO-protein ligase [Canna indica]